MPFFWCDDTPKALLCFKPLNFRSLKFRSLIRRLSLQVRAQLVAGDSVWESGKVFNFLDVDQMPARDICFYHQGRKAMAGSKQGCGQAGKARTNDDNVIVGHGELQMF